MIKNTITILVALFLLLTSIVVDADEPETSKKTNDFELDFQTVTFDQWQNTIASFKGKVLVVDMWATWCISCIERFPYMVEMNKEYQGKGIEFVSLLLEDPEEPEAIKKAKDFLIKQKAGFKHYFMNENLMLSFDKLDLLGIPAVFIYGTDGQLFQRLTGDNPNKQFTENDIKETLEGLILTSK